MSTNDKKELILITYGFYENLYSLCVFNEQIGQLAEEYDQSTKGEFIARLAGLAGLPKDKLDAASNTSFELHFIPKNNIIKSASEEKEGKVFPEATHESKAHESIDNNDHDSITESPQNDNIFEIEVSNGQQLIQLFEFLQKSKRYTTRQSRLLRQGALISLVSYFEALEADLLRFFYLTYPAALPSEGKLISLVDLREIGSIEDAEKLLISREIDAFLRESTDIQLDYFSKRPKIDLKCLVPYSGALSEIIQRRNLFVHNSGVVNKIYLSKVEKEFIDLFDVKDGKEVGVEGKYLSEAIDTVCVCGTMLIQQSWRKWDEKNVEQAEEVFREYIYDLLIERRWNLVEKMADYADSLHFLSDISARTITINQAIALKEQNKLTEMKDLLGNKDWSSCALKFHVALYALDEQYQKMIPLLEKAVAAGEIDKEALEVWPLFRWFRESEHFQVAMDKIFPS